jgi:hypothetical protein
MQKRYNKTKIRQKDVIKLSKSRKYIYLRAYSEEQNRNRTGSEAVRQ